MNSGYPGLNVFNRLIHIGGYRALCEITKYCASSLPPSPSCVLVLSFFVLFRPAVHQGLLLRDNMADPHVYGGELQTSCDSPMSYTWLISRPPNRLVARPRTNHTGAVLRKIQTQDGSSSIADNRQYLCTFCTHVLPSPPLM